jgi:superfamily I DNA and/or RNA helicase
MAESLGPEDCIYYEGAALTGLAWIDTKAQAEHCYEQKGSTTSYKNILEARIVSDAIESLFTGVKCCNQTIGAICMYMDQVQLIHEYLQAMPSCRQAIMSGQLEVGTVDSFQGRERDIIFVSLVRSNRDNSVGFLNLPNRINVTISRAKKHLIIVGNSATATSQSDDSAIQRVYRFVEKNSGRWDCNLLKANQANLAEDLV